MQYAFVWSLIVATLCFVLGKITREYSWVDRLWPLLPIGYGFHYLNHQEECGKVPIALRQKIMLGMMILWGCKHTFNFGRKGGFKRGGQDYRWVYIKEHYHWILVELLNFFFIAYYQLVLIQWFSAPIYFAHNGPLNTIDYALIGVWVLLFTAEFVADQQQWNFQSAKYKLLKENGNNYEKLPSKYRLGFCVEGLWSYCRHPNFFCEISIWWVMFFFSVNSVGLNYSGIGSALLHLLFFGSTGLTEQISSEKYPKYKIYQQTTPRLYPLPPSKKIESLKQE